MTIASETSRVNLVGNGVNDTFTYTFEIYVKTDLQVYVDNVLQEVDVNYTVPDAGLKNPDGGTIVFGAEYIPALAAVVSIILNLPYTQLIDYVEADKFPAETHERGLDRLVKIAQQLKERIARQPTLLESSQYNDLTLPDPVASKLLAWKDDLSGIKNVEIQSEGDLAVTDYIKTLLDDESVLAARSTLIDNSYFPDPAQADQGAAVGLATIKDFVDSIGTSKKATIVLSRGSVGNTTTYTLTTSETIPSNITLRMEPGVILDGAGTLTQNGPLEVGLGQCFGTSITVVFGAGAVKECYPEWWGENTTPGTTDMTAEIQAACDAFPMVVLQNETYEATHIDLNSYNTLVGKGWSTILHQVTGTSTRGGAGWLDGLLTVNYLNNATPFKSVTIKDMQLRMDSKTPPYVSATNEFEHLIMTGHAEDITIDNVFFYGWRGDAITLGSQIWGVGHGTYPTPANHVTSSTSIINCRFDGINYMNRQAISLLSVDGALVDNNYFTRTTEAAMPGAIDIEPELVTGYARGITISNNRFYLIGDAGDRKPPLRLDFGNMDVTNPERKGRIAFKDNTVITASGIWITGDAAAAVFTEPVPIEISGNTFRGVTGSWTMTGVNGLIIEDNTFLDGGLLQIGFALLLARRVKILNNVFDTCPVDLGSPIALSLSDDVEIAGNSFIDCGVDAGVGNVAIYMVGANIGTNIHDNDFSTPNAITATSVYNNAGTQDGNSTFLNNILEDSIALPVQWVGGYGCNEVGLLSITTVAFNANADTVLYTVPTGKRCVLSYADIIAGADAGATTTISIGANGAETDFVPNNTLSNLDAQYDSVIVKPIPNTTPLKGKSYAATTVIDARVANQSGGATNTVYLFGILY